MTAEKTWKANASRRRTGDRVDRWERIDIERDTVYDNGVPAQNTLYLYKQKPDKTWYTYKKEYQNLADGTIKTKTYEDSSKIDYVVTEADGTTYMLSEGKPNIGTVEKPIEFYNVTIGETTFAVPADKYTPETEDTPAQLSWVPPSIEAKLKADYEVSKNLSLSNPDVAVRLPPSNLNIAWAKEVVQKEIDEHATKLEEYQKQLEAAKKVEEQNRLIDLHNEEVRKTNELIENQYKTLVATEKVKEVFPEEALEQRLALEDIKTEDLVIKALEKGELAPSPLIIPTISAGTTSLPATANVIKTAEGLKIEPQTITHKEVIDQSKSEQEGDIQPVVNAWKIVLKAADETAITPTNIQNKIEWAQEVPLVTAKAVVESAAKTGESLGYQVTDAVTEGMKTNPILTTALAGPAQIKYEQDYGQDKLQAAIDQNKLLKEIEPIKKEDIDIKGHDEIKDIIVEQSKEAIEKNKQVIEDLKEQGIEPKALTVNLKDAAPALAAAGAVVSLPVIASSSPVISGFGKAGLMYSSGELAESGLKDKFTKEELSEHGMELTAEGLEGLKTATEKSSAAGQSLIDSSDNFIVQTAGGTTVMLSDYARSGLENPVAFGLKQGAYGTAIGAGAQGLVKIVPKATNLVKISPEVGEKIGKVAGKAIDPVFDIGPDVIQSVQIAPPEQKAAMGTAAFLANVVGEKVMSPKEFTTKVKDTLSKIAKETKNAEAEIAAKNFLKTKKNQIIKLEDVQRLPDILREHVQFSIEAMELDQVYGRKEVVKNIKSNDSEIIVQMILKEGAPVRITPEMTTMSKTKPTAYELTGTVVNKKELAATVESPINEQMKKEYQESNTVEQKTEKQITEPKAVKEENTVNPFLKKKPDDIIVAIKNDKITAQIKGTDLKQIIYKGEEGAKAKYDELLVNAKKRGNEVKVHDLQTAEILPMDVFDTKEQYVQHKLDVAKVMNDYDQRLGAYKNDLSPNKNALVETIEPIASKTELDNMEQLKFFSKDQTMKPDLEADMTVYETRPVKQIIPAKVVDSWSQRGFQEKTSEFDGFPVKEQLYPHEGGISYKKTGTIKDGPRTQKEFLFGTIRGTEVPGVKVEREINQNQIEYKTSKNIVPAQDETKVTKTTAPLYKLNRAILRKEGGIFKDRSLIWDPLTKKFRKPSNIEQANIDNLFKNAELKRQEEIKKYQYEQQRLAENKERLRQYDIRKKAGKFKRMQEQEFNRKQAKRDAMAEATQQHFLNKEQFQKDLAYAQALKQRDKLIRQAREQRKADKVNIKKIYKPSDYSTIRNQVKKDFPDLSEGEINRYMLKAYKDYQVLTIKKGKKIDRRIQRTGKKGYHEFLLNEFGKKKTQTEVLKKLREEANMQRTKSKEATVTIQVKKKGNAKNYNTVRKQVKKDYPDLSEGEIDAYMLKALKDYKVTGKNNNKVAKRISKKGYFEYLLKRFNNKKIMTDERIRAKKEVEAELKMKQEWEKLKKANKNKKHRSKQYATAATDTIYDIPQYERQHPNEMSNRARQYFPEGQRYRDRYEQTTSPTSRTERMSDINRLTPKQYNDYKRYNKTYFGIDEREIQGQGREHFQSTRDNIDQRSGELYDHIVEGRVQEASQPTATYQDMYFNTQFDNLQEQDQFTQNAMETYMYLPRPTEEEVFPKKKTKTKQRYKKKKNKRKRTIYYNPQQKSLLQRKQDPWLRLIGKKKYSDIMNQIMKQRYGNQYV